MVEFTEGLFELISDGFVVRRDDDELVCAEVDCLGGFGQEQGNRDSFAGCVYNMVVAIALLMRFTILEAGVTHRMMIAKVEILFRVCGERLFIAGT